MTQLQRCPWAGPEEIYIEYHDREWGRPLHDDRRLFELLVLEGMQAGLSWITVLKKREAFRRAFQGFDPERVARYGEADIEALLQNPAIIRHRGKLNAAVENARAFLEIQGAYGSFDRFLWAYVDGAPIINHPAAMEEVPASTPLSEAISRDLKRWGFRFVGPTIVYSFLQAAGLVDDHMIWCPWHTENRREDPDLSRADFPCDSRGTVV